MKILIEKNGHQYYHKWQGEVIKWTETVSYWQGSGNFQVPAVLLDTGKEIILLPLSEDRYQYTITKING